MSVLSRLVFLAGPLRRLDAAARRWREGDYSARAGLQGDSDLERLCQTLDRMAEALQESERERARDEELLRQSRDDALRANEAKTRFLAAASHDLRQPLQALSMGISVLEQRHRGQEQELSMLARLKRAVVSLTDLLNSLLDISALEAGATTPDVVDFPVDRLLATLAEDFRQPATDKGIDYRVDPCGAWVRSDPQHLARMLRNLVDNAMKLTPAEGSVHVRCLARPGRVDIQVADSGPGAREEATRGLAPLGLASVERMSRLLGHAVRVQSEPGPGSTFTIEVARAPAVASADGPQAAESGRATGGRILLVEDDALVAEATAGLLAEWGREVTVASTAEEALDFIAREGQAFGLVIADYRLPSGSGLDVVATAILKWPHVKAAILTGDRESVAREGMIASGVHLLEKPIRASQLAELVEVEPAERSF